MSRSPPASGSATSTRAQCRVAGVVSLAAVLTLGPLLTGRADADEGRTQVEQRIGLTARLIADAPSAQRIGASGDAQAVAHFEEGRVRHALAQEALARGDVAGARREVEEALRLIGRARRLVPDMQSRLAAARMRYEQGLANLERLLEAWQRHAPPGEIDDGDRVQALALLATARYFAQQGRHEEAAHTLANADWHVLTGMNRLLRARELDYTARAATPAEEFELELTRHQALADLVPLAVNEFKPAAEALALIGRYGEASRSLRAQAQQQFRAGDTVQALGQIRSATSYVQRALGAAGLAVPAPTGSAP